MDDPSANTQALPAGARLEEFIIERALGSGGFGITYLARDTGLNRQVVIKENLPAQFAWRETTSGTVRPRHTSGGDADDYQWSMNNFLREAETLASLDHPGIVRVLRKFEANGTAYFVMPFVDGVALDTLIEDRRSKNKPFTEEELRGLLDRLLAALGYLHDRGIYHRDIKPGNILISNDGVPALIDFGSARQRLSERSMTVIESAGYTPFEQLQSRGNVGPWSDLYALGATLVKAMTFETLPKAADRVMDDPWQGLATHPEVSHLYSSPLLSSIDRAVESSASARWQDAGEWREGLRGGVSAGAAHSQTATHQASDRKATQAPPAKTAGATESEPGNKTSPPPRQRFGKQRGRDLRFDLEISQQAATSGIEKEIEIERLVACGTCQSTGSKGGGGTGPCGSCGGRGVIVGHGGKMVQETTCPECQGAGETVSDLCDSCQGEGRAEKLSRVRFRIPAGVEDGSRVRLAGYGDAGFRGDEVGDLYLYLSVTDSPRDESDEAVNRAPEIAPALWDPTTVVNLGVIFTPAFAAFLHARNSKALGHSAGEISGMYWAYGMAACAFIGILFAGTLGYFTSINLLILILWYFTSAKKQIRLVETRFGKNYPKKPLAKPMLIGFGCLFAAVIFVEGLHSLVREEPGTKEAKAKAEAKAEMEERDFEIAPGVSMTFCWVPAGEFMMGSPVGELGRDDDETQHRVRITKGYWMGKYEVTQAQWRAVMGSNPSNFKGDGLPVESVSWNDIAGPEGFIEKANQAAAVGGGRFSLPTEAQWEYAARGGTTTALNNGKNLTSKDGECVNLNEVGWHGKNSGNKTHPVGQKRANAWGLYDMHGNVVEWCADWYGSYSTGNLTDPVGATSGSDRVLRGGYWFNVASYCRVAYRFNYSPSLTSSNIGFRVARSSGT